MIVIHGWPESYYETLYENKLKAKLTSVMAQTVECLLSRHKNLSSITSTTKKKKERKKTK
jgi:hypothetical protein